MIAAVIFDMDGLLVDSEPLWRRAEMEAFAEVGVALTETMCLETTGLRIDQVIDHWQRRIGFSGKSHEALRRDILARVQRLIETEAQPLPGARAAVERAARERPIALASSSPHAIIDAVLSRFGIRALFQMVHSAEDEEYGKPHPAVFITTASRLGVAAVDCLVFEDSLNGMIAAKAARMRCIVIPEEPKGADPRFILADRRFDSLEAIDDETWKAMLA